MTEPELRIEDLTPRWQEAAVAVLARHTRHPINVAVYGPDPDRRERCHARLVRGLLRTSKMNRPIGVWHADVGCTGVALAGSCRPGPRQTALMVPALFALGPRTAARVRT